MRSFTTSLALMVILLAPATAADLLPDGETRLVSADAGIAVHPDVSADAGRIAFFDQGSRRVLVRDLDEGRTLLASSDASGNPARGEFGAAISGDGRFVAFATRDPMLLPPDAKAGVVRKDLETGRVEVIAATDSLHAGLVFRQIDVSHDGRLVAFLSTIGLHAEDLDGAYDAYARDVSTGVLHALSDGLTGSLADVSLTGAGDSAVLWHFVSGTVYETLLVNVATGASRLISDDTTFAVAPAVSGSGTHVAYGRSVAPHPDHPLVVGGFDLVWLDLASGERRILPQVMEGYETPSLSWDGSRVLFRAAPPFWGVFAWSPLDGDLTLVSRAEDEIGTPDLRATDPVLSADGRHAVFATSTRLSAEDGDDVSDVYLRTLRAAATT